jgi:peptide/nickel transport system permease protein
VTGYVLRRLAHAVVVVLVVATITFVVVRLAPGGPSLLADPKLTPTEAREIERRLGIDRPLPEQYARWLSRLARGDLGHSFLYQTPTLQTILARLPNTALLAGLALALAVGVALPLGVQAAARPGSLTDRLTSALSFLALSTPVFWLGLLLLIVFAVALRVLPAGGASTPGLEGSLIDRARHLVLPVVVLATGISAELLRYTRTTAAAVYRRHHILTARAIGLDERSIRRRHVLRNTLVPVVTLVGLQLPRLVGGAAVTETIFSWPGLGRLGVEAALSRDYPLIMGLTLFVAVAVVAASLVVDLLYVRIDPRVRLK